MRDKHYIEKLSQYINHELSRDERQTIGEHLMICESCRREHDEIKLGAELARSLQQADAPVGVWNSIDAALISGRRANIDFFNLRSIAVTVGVLLIAGVSASIIYFGASTSDGDVAVQNDTTTQPVSSLPDPSKNTSQDEFRAQANAVQAPETRDDMDVSIPELNVDNAGSKNDQRRAAAVTATLASWSVETLAGTPKIDGGSGEKIAVGEFLETDANSRARIEVANIGDVEVAPNSRVKLVNSNRRQHRLALERGKMHAKIFAPPRLFIVDTPSSTAVDLGCEYTLEVDAAGNSKLHVTSGFVALERDGHESIVPAGAMCYTRRGKGLGTPFSPESTVGFQAALLRFDFSNGGSSSVNTILKEARFFDIITLWHLLSRVSRTDREDVFDALSKYAAPPTGVTRDGIMKLDRKMLDDWRDEVERLWFE